MTDDLRTRIFKTLLDHWPAPLFGSDRQLQQIVDLTDQLIAEVQDAERTVQGSNRDTQTLHEALTHAIWDNLPPRVASEAEDIADVAIATVADYRLRVGEDVFLDNIII